MKITKRMLKQLVQEEFEAERYRERSRLSRPASPSIGADSDEWRESLPSLRAEQQQLVDMLRGHAPELCDNRSALFDSIHGGAGIADTLADFGVPVPLATNIERAVGGRESDFKAALTQLCPEDELGYLPGETRRPGSTAMTGMDESIKRLVKEEVKREVARYVKRSRRRR